ncbi:MAG TPA: GNAT family N-acetyltransferase [Dissulfurispiraceae bacterium]|nr:GNAT family N-acetyltransferase [Dissulfurispiraceae bacterium]
MSIKNLDFFFNPKRIAVLGASEDPRVMGCSIFGNLIGKGYKGAVYPVNGRVDSVQGVEAYRTITDIERDIDLAILADGPEVLLDQLEQCGQKGVKGVIILCPDFHFRATDPQQMEAKIRGLSGKYGFRILGPNSLGFIRPGKGINASIFPKMPPKGNIACIAQGSTLGLSLLDRAVSKKVGFSYFVSLGSKFDIDFADMIDFLGVDPETRAIILYVESLWNGRKFMTAVRSYSYNKPIVVFKSGKYEESAHVALTHSGRLAGEDIAYEAAFNRAGAVRADDMLDLFYLAETLSKQARPKGNRLAIVSNAGGPAVIAVDTLLKQGGVLAPLGPETIESLKSVLPQSKRLIQNPVDLLSDASPQQFETAISSCLKDKDVDGVLVIQTPSFGAKPNETAEMVAAASKANPYKPIFTSWMGEESVSVAREILNERKIPTFVTPEQAARNFIYMYRYDDNLRLLLETPEDFLKDFFPEKGKVVSIIKDASQRRKLLLSLHEAKEILSAYGIPVIRTEKASVESEALRISDEIGYPVVLKIDSPKIFHRLKEGGVILNIKDRDSVSDAFKRLRQVAEAAGDPDAPVLVQPMIIKHGFEVVIGAKKDPTFGAVILFGTGGELLSALEDYAVALPPLNQALARHMMRQTKIYRYLQGLPNYADILKHLEEMVVRFSQLIVDFHHIKEVDINPFFITESGSFALDAGILLEDEILDGFVQPEGELCPPHLSICPYPRKFATEITLKNGAHAIIRPIRPEDEPMIAELFDSFSEQTIVLRFFQRFPHLSHEQLVRYCQIDYDRELALVCVVEDEGQEKIIGDVRMIKQADMEMADMAIMVSDKWQGLGVGIALSTHCMKVAKDAGIRRVFMDILKINTYMLNLSKRLGFKRTESYDDYVEVRYEMNGEKS